jgi:hemerythrin-like domain-containing protein
MLDAAEKISLFHRPPHPEAMREDPIGYLEYDHAAQRALADLLETIADGLPWEVNRAGAAFAASLLRRSAARHAALEDEALFPLLEARARDEVTRAAIAIARREHGDAAGRAIELAEELDVLAARGAARNAESLGFMLRAFFDGHRRHLDWVEAAILPQARRVFGPEDLAELGERLADLAEGDRLRDWAGLAVIDGARASV